MYSEWLDSLLQRPRMDLQRLVTDREEVVIVATLRRMVVLYRGSEEVEFSRVPSRRVNKLLEEVRSRNPQVEETTI